MRYFPIFLDLRGRTVLLVGTGQTAHRKAALLERAGAKIRYAEHFTPEALAGCTVAVGASSDESDLKALSAAAQTAGIPVNIVDRPTLCSFIMPAIVDREPITIAIGSGGAAPVLARLLRARVEAAVPPAFGRLAAIADAFRVEIRRRLPDLGARRRLLERLFTGRAAELAFAGREAEARAEFSVALAGEPIAGGMVFIVGAGPGASDLVTLRAQRLLGEADVVVHDHRMPGAVMELARREAEQISIDPAEDVGALLIALGRADKRVVRLILGDVATGGEADALAAAGVPYEIVPGVSAGA